MNSENEEVVIRPSFREEEGMDLKRYLSLFISNWYWFAIAILISFSLAYGINRYSAPVFNITSSVLIKADLLNTYTGLSQIFPGTENFASQQNIKNEIGILKSYKLNYQVMDSLPEFHVDYTGVGRRGIAESKLYKNCPFIVEFNSFGENIPSHRVYIHLLKDDSYELSIPELDIQISKKKFGERVLQNGYDFVIRKRDSLTYRFDEKASNRFYFSFLNSASLANQYRRKLSITPIEEDATLLILSTSGDVPEQEADYLNKLVDLYIDMGLQHKNKIADQTITFINKQLNGITDSLTVAEDSLEKFRLSNNFIDLSAEGNLIRTHLDKAESERVILMMQKQYFEYLSGYLEKKEISDEIISPSLLGITEPVLLRNIDDLSTLIKQKKELELNLRTDLPAVLLINDKISFVISSIKDNISNNLNNIDASIKDVESRIGAIESDIQSLPGTERRLLGIQRNFDINNTIYTYLLEKRAEAGIARASNVPDNKPIDQADKNNSVKIKPREKRNNLIALILGLSLPGIMILLIDFFNNKVIDRKDVEKGTHAPVLGYISHNDSRTEVPVVENPGSTLAESFRSVRTALKYFLTDNEHPVISISSTVSAEGKTFISINLAAISAMLGKKVLLLGLDLRKPKIHRVFNIDNSIGMSTYLAGETSFKDVIKKTSVVNLYYAPSGPVPPNPAELIESQRMGEFLAEARKEFDFIFIDTPPVAIVTDALLLAPYVDINLFVVRQRYSSKNTLQLIEEFYRAKNLKNLSIIINDISLTGYYGYGLRYGYKLGYGGYSYGYNFYGEYVSSIYGYSKGSKEYYNSKEENSEL